MVQLAADMVAFYIYLSGNKPKASSRRMETVNKGLIGNNLFCLHYDDDNNKHYPTT